MSEFKGTPGPWEINMAATNTGRGIGIDAPHIKYGYIEICEIWGTKNTDRIDDEAKANANLIAASTELLSRLQCSTEFMEQMVDNGDNRQALIERINRNRATIAKALGEQP